MKSTKRKKIYALQIELTVLFVLAIGLIVLFVNYSGGITGADIIGAEIGISGITGCNPNTEQCTDTCDGLFIGLGDNWDPDPNGCNGMPMPAIVGNNDYCAGKLGAGTGDCASFNSEGLYVCPSYTRKGSAVTSNDCACTEGECMEPPEVKAPQLFDFTDTFFAGVVVEDVYIANSTQCGYVNGNVTLTTLVNSSKTCFTINASAIVLDCAGNIVNYSVSGAGSKYGVIINGFNNVTIKNCQIKEGKSAAGQWGVYLSNAQGGIIKNNSIATIGSGGGVLLGSSNFNKLIDNNINMSGSGSGISFSSSSSNEITDNNITTGSGTGIAFEVSSANSLINNSVTTSGGGNGIQFGNNDGAPNILINNKVRITGNGYGVYLSGDIGTNKIINGIINASAANDIYAAEMSGISLNLTNVTFNKTDIGFNEMMVTGGIYVKWYVQAYANYSGEALSGAAIAAKNRSGIQIESKTSGADGYVPEPFELVEFYQTSSAKVYHTPHTLQASKTGYAIAAETINLTSAESSTVYITLGNTSYNFSLSQPSNQSVYNNTNATYTFTITNLGARADNYTISITNTNNANTAAANVSSISNLGSGGSTAQFALTVGSAGVGNYSVTATVTSAGDNSRQETALVKTEVLETPPSLNVTLVNPTSNTNFIYGNNNEFTVLVSCSRANCGEVNISLDPITGCNPNTEQCTNTCNGLFFGNLEDDWGPDPNGCNGMPMPAIVGNNDYCAGKLGAGTGDCASFNSEGLYVCPSYTRKGSAVTSNDCACTEGPCMEPAQEKANQLFDFTDPFFAGAGAAAKSGLVSNTEGATPFWTANSNPATIILNSGESQYLTWWVRATGSPASTHAFYAYANKTSNRSINGESNRITVTLGNDTTSGIEDCWDYINNQAGCEAIGCVYDLFTGYCRFNHNNLGCNDFCDMCTTQLSCNSSSKNCAWESTWETDGEGIWETEGYCHENYSSFNFGEGGNFNQESGWWEDVRPPNCMNNPAECDSMFDTTYNFVEFEGCCFDNIDNEQDGTTDCEDTDCYNTPECEGVYDPNTDTTAPQVKNLMVTPDNDSATFSFVSSKPTSAELLFYKTNAACAALNKTITEPDDSTTEWDQYRVYHFILADESSGSLGWTLAQNTRYYYKINITDEAGNGYLSTCSNFTTEAAAKTFRFNFSGDEAAFLQFDFGAGYNDYNPEAGLSKNATKEAKMKFKNFHEMEFNGLEMTSAANFNFTDVQQTGDNCRFSGKECLGIKSETWQQMVQQLGVKNVSLKPAATNCNKIYKCNDNGSICSEVTNKVTCSIYNATNVNLIIPAWLGFSTYVAGANAGLNLTDDTDTTTKRVNQIINFYANYTNLTNSLPLTPTAYNANCNITINGIGVNQVNMMFNASGDGRWNYTTSAFTVAGTYDWTVNCSATGFDALNATDTVTVTAAATEATASSGAGSSTGGSGGGTFNTESVFSRTFERIEKDKAIKIDFPKIESLNQIELEVTEDLENDWLKVEKIIAPKKFEQVGYNFFKISSGKIGDKLKTAKIYYSVEREWLAKKGLDRFEIALFRLNGNAWEELPGDLRSIDNNYFYYMATTGKFSYFAVGEKEKKNLLPKLSEITGLEEEREEVEKAVEEAEEKAAVKEAEGKEETKKALAGMALWQSSKEILAKYRIAGLVLAGLLTAGIVIYLAKKKQQMKRKKK